MRLVSVVMGSRSAEARANDSQALLNYGFRFFETHKLYSGGEEIVAARVWKGAAETVALGVTEDFYLTIPKGRYDSLTTATGPGRGTDRAHRRGRPLGVRQHFPE